MCPFITRVEIRDNVWSPISSTKPIEDYAVVVLIKEEPHGEYGPWEEYGEQFCRSRAVRRTYVVWKSFDGSRIKWAPEEFRRKFQRGELVTVEGSGDYQFQPSNLHEEVKNEN